MGASCSRDGAIATAPAPISATPSVSASSGLDDPLKDAKTKARTLNEEEWLGSQRISFNEFMELAKDAQGPERQLVVCTLAPPVYTAELEVFKPWCEMNPGNGGAVACMMSTSTLNFGATMLRGLMEVSEAIAHAHTAVPNRPVQMGQLISVLRYKDIWRRLLKESAVQSFNHPVLRRVASVQPLLVSCALCRLGIPGYGEDQRGLHPIFNYLLDHGASGRVRTNLGLTPLMLLAAAFADSLDPSRPSRPLLTSHTLQLTKLLLERGGADPAALARPFGPPWGMGPHANTYFYLLEPLLQGTSPFTALDVLEHVLSRQAAGGTTGRPSQQDMLDNMRALLHPGSSRQATATAVTTAATAAATYAAATADGPTPPLVSCQARQPVPWTQAIFNIIWAVAQVTQVASVSERCAVLEEVRGEAPFVIPPLMMVSGQQLKQLGYIPRFSSGPDAHPSWAPLPVSALPEGAVTVFISHRWLGKGCPDDEEGNKLQQVLRIAELIGQKRKVPTEQVHLWIDYSVVDQADPMPGVQALPIYIACCDEFVYVHHDEYWERAWCLTEQYMFWKLCRGKPRHCFQPCAHPPSASSPAYAGRPGPHQVYELVQEDTVRRPPDPALGKLFHEGDRVALATLTAIMPETD